MGLRPDNLKNGSNGNTKIQAIQALIKCGLNNKNKDWTDPNSRSTIPSSWNDVENRLERHSQNTQFPLSGSVLEPIKEKTILSGVIQCTQQAGRQLKNISLGGSHVSTPEQKYQSAGNHSCHLKYVWTKMYKVRSLSLFSSAGWLGFVIDISWLIELYSLWLCTNQQTSLLGSTIPLISRYMPLLLGLYPNWWWLPSGNLT